MSLSTPDLSNIRKSLEEMKKEMPIQNKYANLGLGVIEEKGDECTGMENVKVLLNRKQVENPDIVYEKPKLLVRQPELPPPKSEDLLQRKKNILYREDKLAKQVERLASLQKHYQY